MSRRQIATLMLAALFIAVPARAQDNRPAARPTIAVVAFDTTRTG